MSTWARRSRAIAAALALGWSAPAAADPPVQSAPAPTEPVADPIAAARTAMEDLRYEDALKLVEPLLQATEPSRRAEALQITAIAHLVVGDQEAGKRAVAELYAIAPGFALSDASLPARVTGVFEEEAARAHPRGVTPALRPHGKDVHEFELAAGPPAARVELTCRSGSAGPYLPVSTSPAGGAHRFRLPAANSHRCYAVALDASGLPLGRLGTAAHPFEVRPRPVAAPPKDSPVTGRWWFWAGLGTVAVAAATVAVIAATRPGDPTPPAADITATAKRWSW